MYRLSSAFLAGLLAVLLALLTLSLSFSLLLTPLPTHVLAGWFSDGAPSGYTHEQMVEVADGILEYSLGNDDVQFPQGTSNVTAMDEESLAHLRDCRVVFRGVISLAVFCAVAAMIALVALGLKRRRKTIAHGMTAAWIAVCAVVVACVVWAIVDFGAFFDWVHHLFFAQGSWYFEADSLMICALPTRFWICMGVLWALLIAVMCVCWALIARRLGKMDEA